jgi:hypothetical protein
MRRDQQAFGTEPIRRYPPTEPCGHLAGRVRRRIGRNWRPVGVRAGPVHVPSASKDAMGPATRGMARFVAEEGSPRITLA